MIAVSSWCESTSLNPSFYNLFMIINGAHAALGQSDNLEGMCSHLSHRVKHFYISTTCWAKNWCPWHIICTLHDLKRWAVLSTFIKQENPLSARDNNSPKFLVAGPGYEILKIPCALLTHGICITIILLASTKKKILTLIQDYFKTIILKIFSILHIRNDATGFI